MQGIRRDDRFLVWFRRTQPHAAARGRLEIAGGDGNCREAVQGIAELVERQRLHMELDVSAFSARIRTREDAEL